MSATQVQHKGRVTNPKSQPTKADFTADDSGSIQALADEVHSEHFDPKDSTQNPAEDVTVTIVDEGPGVVRKVGAAVIDADLRKVGRGVKALGRKFPVRVVRVKNACPCEEVGEE